MEKKTKRINKSKYNVSEELPAVRVGRLRDISEQDIQKLADQLTAWSHTPKADTIIDFIKHKKLSPMDFFRWCNKFPELMEAKNNALYMIGNNREKMALTNKYNANFVMQTMPLYNPEHRALLEWKAKLAREQNDHSGDKIIVVERFHDAPKSEEPK